MRISEFWDICKKSVNAWIDDDASSMGAAIAYYTIFSIAPLLVIVIAVAGFVWGREAVRGEIVDQIAGMVGTDAARTIQDLLESAWKDSSGAMATAIGLVVLLVGATSAFTELQRALDTIWRQPSLVQENGLWNLLRKRLLSFGLIFGLAFLLIVSLVASAAIAALGRWTSLLPAGETLLLITNFALSMGITTLLFACIYKLMPRARIDWRDVWVGAFVTALLFEAGKLLIGLYLGKTGVASSFGAAGSLAVLLVWVYYSAQIFLLGAEFTWVYASQHGSLSDARLKSEAETPPHRPASPSS